MQKANKDMDRFRTVPPPWLTVYSLEEFDKAKTRDLEDAWKDGRFMIIRKTGLNKGWEFDMKSASKITSPSDLVEVQGTLCRVSHTICCPITMQTSVTGAVQAALRIAWCRCATSSILIFTIQRRCTTFRPCLRRSSSYPSFRVKSMNELLTA